MRITVPGALDLDEQLARKVQQHQGPVWVMGLKSLSEASAGVLAGHREALHLPDVEYLSDRAAENLALHKGPLHLDNLIHISDEGLLHLAAHPDLWIPDDIDARMTAVRSDSVDDLEQEPDSDDSEWEDVSSEGDEEDEEDPESDEDDSSTGDADQEDEDDVGEEDYDEESSEAAHKPAGSPPSGLDGLLAPLDSLVGLEGVKQVIRSVASLARIDHYRRRQGLSVAPASYHMAFYGPPGTGKTTVARLVASILREAGVLARGHLVETDGQGLVAKYLGQTGHRVKQFVEKSLGGVLFIDEAYSLAPRDGNAGAYASEAIATLVPLLETHREDLIVILAGYDDEMNELFTANPGLRSRFSYHMVFPPMEMDQLEAVYRRLAEDHGYLMSTQFKASVRHMIDREKRIRGGRFGNARAVRTLFEGTLRRQAERLANIASPSVIQLQTLLVEDLPESVP